MKPARGFAEFVCPPNATHRETFFNFGQFNQPFIANSVSIRLVLAEPVRVRPAPGNFSKGGA